MNNELTQWFNQQPFFTKWICVFSLIIPVILKFRLMTPHYFVFYWPYIIKNFQIWRPFTSVMIANVNLGFIFSLYFRYQYSMYLETLQFAGQPADYLWFLLMNITLLSLMNAYMGLSVMWEGFSMAIVHVWSQYNKAVTVNFMFGLKFPAVYLPGVMAIYSLVMGGDVLGTIMGIFVGHFFYFGKEILGRQNPRVLRFFEAPPLLRKLVGNIGKLAPGQTVSKGEGYTVHAPNRPYAKLKEEAPATFKPFSGSGSKLGAE